MKIGILSDTHGVLREEVKKALEGCSALYHAGDVGNYSIYEELMDIAPLRAVRGNADGSEFAFLPEVLSFAEEGVRICMAHKLSDLPAGWEKHDLVITGHTHKFSLKQQDSYILLNPGSCGPVRLKEMTLAIWTPGGPGLLESITRVDLLPEENRFEVPPGKERKAVQKTVTLLARNKTVEEIARKYSLPEEWVEKVAQIYYTHPGADLEGILQRLGL